jgi:hypothetical protein
MAVLANLLFCKVAEIYTILLQVLSIPRCPEDQSPANLQLLNHCTTTAVALGTNVKLTPMTDSDAAQPLTCSCPTTAVAIGTVVKLTPMTDRMPAPHCILKGRGMEVTWMKVMMPHMMRAAWMRSAHA